MISIDVGFLFHLFFSFLLHISHPWSVESTDAEPMDAEGWLYPSVFSPPLSFTLSVQSTFRTIHVCYYAFISL
jgi:hypothetical protein